VNIWLEHSHRLLAGALGLALATQAVWALARFRSRGDVLWPAVVAASAVVVQSLLGALVVLELLRAELVTAHLGLAMAVVACQLTLVVSTSRAWSRGGERHPIRTPALAVAAVTYLQILVGGHVTGIGAGLVFDQDPLLGLATFSPVASEPEAFNIVHRALGIVVVAAVVWLARRARALEAHGWLVRIPWVAVALAGVQVLLGVANLWSGLSFLSVIPHLAVASWLWAVLVLEVLLAWRVSPAAVMGARSRREPELASSTR
jgi:cytochrome c oxidase assembly protein subunit 15